MSNSNILKADYDYLEKIHRLENEIETLNKRLCEKPNTDNMFVLKIDSTESYFKAILGMVRDLSVRNNTWTVDEETLFEKIIE